MASRPFGLKNNRRNLTKVPSNKSIHFVDFLESMTGDTYKEQLEKTAALSYADLNFYCIVAFGEKAKLDPITKRQSLWR